MELCIEPWLISCKKTKFLLIFQRKKKEIEQRFHVSFDPGVPGEPVKVIFENKDITSLVRTEEIAKLTSNLAAEPIIRDFIKPCQRDFMQAPGLIADGRDMGTVIFLMQTQNLPYCFSRRKSQKTTNTVEKTGFGG